MPLLVIETPGLASTHRWLTLYLVDLPKLAGGGGRGGVRTLNRVATPTVSTAGVRGSPTYVAD